MGVYHIRRYAIGVVIAVILAMFLATWSNPVVVTQGSSVVVANHPQPGIWDCTNVKNTPSQALVVTLQQEQWQAVAATCLAPAFFDRTSSIPLFYDDGTEIGDIAIPHSSKAVTDFGSDAATATAGIATTYWSKAGIVVITDTYEHVLWLVPTANFLAAPILINPTAATLTSLGAKCAIVLGASEPLLDEVIVLKDKEDVWQFQLELFDTKGEMCEYVILTNPHDTDDSIDTNIKWPFLSLSSAPLAAHRKAIVQTGDWTTPKDKIEDLELCIEKDDTLYNEVKPYFEKVKEDSYAAERFLYESGHEPQFLCVVGGPYAIPNYFYDVHVNYRYPTGNPQRTVYPASLAAYTVLQESVSDNQYTQEDLAAGRIMTSSLMDASKQLMKGFFYREYLPGGAYHSLAPSDWQNTSSIVDGHRLNQPEPNNLLWDPDVPYHPASSVFGVFDDAGYDTTYYLPRNESDPYDSNMTIAQIMDTVNNSSLLQILPHGGSSSLRIEIGIEPISGEGKSKFLTADSIRDLDFLAPTICYTGSCKSANAFMLDEGFNTTSFTATAFIHAGCIAFIGTPEIQSTCFWREAPYGVSTQQNIYFWEKLLDSNIPIGKALKEAKWEGREWAIEQWPEENDINGTFEIDCLVYYLFGDPALEPYKANVSFDSKEDMDIVVDYGEVKAGKKLDVNVAVSSLSTGQNVESPQIFIKFNGDVESGSNGSFSVPEKEGDYTLEIEVQKAGYNDITASYVIQVKGTETEGDTTLILVILLIVIIVVAVVVILSKIKRKSKRA